MSELRYLETHEWFIEIDGVFTVGISEYAQGELGDIVFVTMPEVNSEFDKGSPVVELEATKTIAEIYAPFDCKVLEINDLLETEPELINSDPLGVGWLFKASSENYSETGMSESEYLILIA
jgi:glycine cleavage system H protein